MERAEIGQAAIRIFDRQDLAESLNGLRQAVRAILGERPIRAASLTT